MTFQPPSRGSRLYARSTRGLLCFHQRTSAIGQTAWWTQCSDTGPSKALRPGEPRTNRAAPRLASTSTLPADPYRISPLLMTVGSSSRTCAKDFVHDDAGFHLVEPHGHDRPGHHI